jgi:hypothetical protein
MPAAGRLLAIRVPLATSVAREDSAGNMPTNPDAGVDGMHGSVFR